MRSRTCSPPKIGTKIRRASETKRVYLYGLASAKLAKQHRDTTLSAMFEKILFPVDRSLETSHALELAVDLARKYDSSVTLLFVLDASELDDATAAEKQRQHGQALLKQAEAALHRANLSQVETVLREGKVAFAICDAADDLKANLVVMGSRGVGLTEDGSEDSVSSRVINLSPCPVLVVP